MSRDVTLKPPSAHTVLIGDPVAMWEKLCWDVELFQEIQRSYPSETQPLAFAAINVCIAAWSLEKWTQSAWKQKNKKAQSRTPDSVFHKMVEEHIPEQKICFDIANTAKHANYRDNHWQGGEVRLVWEDGDEDVPATYVLKHIDPAGATVVLAFNTFEKVKNDWWAFLLVLGLASGPRYLPEFMQNKLRRIFGDRVHQPPSEVETVEI